MYRKAVMCEDVENHYEEIGDILKLAGIIDELVQVKD